MNMFENESYTFYVINKDGISPMTEDIHETDITGIDAHKKESLDSYKCVLKQTDVVMPFTSIKHLVMFFKCGILGANNFTCNISTDKGLVITVTNFASTYEITKTFTFTVVDGAVESKPELPLDELVKITREQIVKILCDYELWAVWLNCGQVRKEREIQFATQQTELYHKKGTKLQDLYNPITNMWWEQNYKLQGSFASGKSHVQLFHTLHENFTSGQSYAKLPEKLQESFASGKSYVKMLHDLDAILNGFVHDFATFHTDNRFMNCYCAFLDMMDAVNFDDNKHNGACVSADNFNYNNYKDIHVASDMQRLTRNIYNHHAIKQFESVFPSLLLHIPYQRQERDLYIFEMSKKLVGIIAEFIRTLHQHYFTKN